MTGTWIGLILVVAATLIFLTRARTRRHIRAAATRASRE